MVRMCLLYQHSGGRHRQSSMFDICLVYTGNSIPAKATQWDTPKKKLPNSEWKYKHWVGVLHKISIEWENYIFLLYKFRWSSRVLIKSWTAFIEGRHWRHSIGDGTLYSSSNEKIPSKLHLSDEWGIGEHKEQVSGSLISPHWLHPQPLLRLGYC